MTMHDHADDDYRCMPRARLSDDRITVEALRAKHIEPIRRWRNAQMDILRQNEPITKEAQIAYYAREVWPDKARATPKNILLTVSSDNAVIGYGGLVHIVWAHKRAEVSFLLDPEPHRDDADIADLYGRFLRLMQVFAFQDLGLARLTSEMAAIRTLHEKVIERSGFVREGVMRDHVIIHGRPTDAIIHGCLARDRVPL